MQFLPREAPHVTVGTSVDKVVRMGGDMLCVVYVDTDVGSEAPLLLWAGGG